MQKDIIRFYKNGKQKIVFYGVTEYQAKEWCNSEYTHNAKYFDGFSTTGSYGNKKQPIYNQAYFSPTEIYN